MTPTLPEAMARVERLLVGWTITREDKADITRVLEEVAGREKLLRRYLQNHCENADREGMSALCECRTCLDTRAALLETP